MRDRLNEGPELRQHRQGERDARRDHVGRRRVDAGRRHNADVLGVGGRTRTAAAAGQHRGNAVRHKRAARHVVQVLARHRGHGLHVADVLGDQDEDDRQEQAERRHREGGCVELGEAEPSGLADAREVNLTLKNRGHVADQHADEDREATEDALEEDGHEADRHDRHEGGDRAFLDPIPCGGCQVEADERHDRARHHGRHGRVNPAHAREVNDQANRSKRRTRRNDAAERVGGPHGRRHRGNRGDQGERGTQVRGQTARRDQEEQQGADRSEKKRC